VSCKGPSNEQVSRAFALPRSYVLQELIAASTVPFSCCALAPQIYLNGRFQAAQRAASRRNFASDWCQGSRSLTLRNEIGGRWP